MKRVAFSAIVMLIAGSALLAGGLERARANGVPQLVKLTYLDGVSNFGPKDAEGVLEFSFAEAYARVDIKNLKPMDGYTFEGWLTGPGDPLFVGTVTANGSGVGTFQTKLEGLTNYDYNTFVVAARKTGAADGQLPAEISIAGRFTIIGDDGKSATAGDLRPATLPDTGENAPRSTTERVGRTLTITAASAGLAFFFLRYLRSRRSSHDQGTV